MDTSDEDEEASPLICRPGIPASVPDNREPREKQLAVYFILASILFERIAFFTIAANLAIHASGEKVIESSSHGLVTSFSFTGVSYTSTLVFAVISDWKLGRQTTILFGFTIYSIGYISSITVTAPNPHICEQYLFHNTTDPAIHQAWCNVWIIGTLVIIAIGVGAVQSNMVVFGVEQIQESRITSRYFDKYVIVVNIGSICAVWGIRLIFDGIKEPYNYVVNCALATSMLFISILIFIMSRRYYIHVKPYDSVITQCIPVIINALKTQRQYKRQNHSIDNGRINFNSSNSISASNNLNEKEEEKQQQSLALNEQPYSYLDFARVSNHGKFNDRIVDDVKSLRKAFFVFIILIPFWLIYTQLTSTFILQGNYMKDSSQEVANVLLGDPITIIIGILILNVFLYKYFDDRNLSLTIVNKFVIGMCFAVITMVIAGTVEKFRQDGCDEIQNKNNISTLNMLWQLPQNIFMGFSEIFVMIASFEYAYFSAPRSAQTLFMSLRFCSIGIAALIGVGYMAIFARPELILNFQCTPNMYSKWTFCSYFYTLAFIQLIFIIIFIVCQKKFHLIKMNPQQIERNQFVHQSSSRRSIVSRYT